MTAPTGRGTKIKIGFQPSSATSTALISPHEATQTSATDQLAPGTVNRATTTLSELCSATFGRRRLKGKKRPRSKDPAAEGARSKNKDPAAQKTRPGASIETNKITGGPQVEIINGKIVVRESSLVVNQGHSAPVDYEEVEEGTHPTATYSSFSKRIYSPPWGLEETRRFYEVLRMCRTDFSLMQVYFPGRTRQQLKSKFYREEKQHPVLVKAALDSKSPLGAVCIADLAPFEIHISGLKEMVYSVDKSAEEADSIQEQDGPGRSNDSGSVYKRLKTRSQSRIPESAELGEVDSRNEEQEQAQSNHEEDSEDPDDTADLVYV